MLPNLRLLRMERGISQQKLADVVMLSQQSINNYENHEAEPDIHVLTRFAEYFDTSIDFIVGFTDCRDRHEGTLDKNDAEVLHAYRLLSEADQDLIRQLMARLAK